MLWVDKYRPFTLDKFDYHKELSKQLADLVAQGDFPHLLVYGPPGAGKKSRIYALLRELYGPGVEKLKVEYRTFKVRSTSVEVTIVSSLYHLELNPSDAGYRDSAIVQEVIKEIAQSHPIDASTQRQFKVIVLHEVDRLSKQAQQALRRTMEKYTSACRLILCATTTCRLMEPLRSRCLAIRIPAPSNEEILSVLKAICKKESISLPEEFAQKIVAMGDRNLRRCILALEASKVQCYPFQKDQQPQIPDWEEYIAILARDILKEQSPQMLLQARKKFYDLLGKCIPPDIILKFLTMELLKKLDTSLKFQVMEFAAFYEQRMHAGSKPIFHLEAFVAKFMSIYKRYLMESFGF